MSRVCRRVVWQRLRVRKLVIRLQFVAWRRLELLRVEMAHKG